MVVNEDDGSLGERGVFESIASKLAPTETASHGRFSFKPGIVRQMPYFKLANLPGPLQGGADRIQAQQQ
ncbi:hypothetical protein SAMN05216558_1689 [Pseudomonas vancouverensis]|nr:hypothetical protein SAMN05216558_1689 [Pseudomonas vancouverensis]